jgi:hypothetical protein
VDHYNIHYEVRQRRKKKLSNTHTTVCFRVFQLFIVDFCTNVVCKQYCVVLSRVVNVQVFNRSERGIRSLTCFSLHAIYRNIGESNQVNKQTFFSLLFYLIFNYKLLLVFFTKFSTHFNKFICFHFPINGIFSSADIHRTIFSFDFTNN